MRAIRVFHCMVFALALLAGASVCRAAEVNVVGLFAGKALVEIDGAKARLMSAGQQVGQVKLISADSSAAVFEIDGKRHTLRLGKSMLGGTSAGGRKPTVVLTADARGHFVTTGTINGISTRFLVDTGASLVAMSAVEAKRLGIRYLQGTPGYANTASGVVRSYMVKLDSVNVGGITVHQVDAGIIEGNTLSVTLLGMSFLRRMEMRREGSTLTLTQQY